MASPAAHFHAIAAARYCHYRASLNMLIYSLRLMARKFSRDARRRFSRAAGLARGAGRDVTRRARADYRHDVAFEVNSWHNNLFSRVDITE